MAVDRGIPVFLYELKFGEWLLWRVDQQRWVQCEGMSEENILPPSLCQNTGIVGTREPPFGAVSGVLEDLFRQYRNFP